MPMHSALGDFSAEAFVVADGREIDTHLVVTHGELVDPVPTRINSACVTSEVFGDDRCDCAWQLEEALRRIIEFGSGVIIYHPNQEGRGIGLFRKLQSYQLMSRGMSTNEAFSALGEPADARSYGAAVTILKALGIDRVRLLSNNPVKMQALEDGGISVQDVDGVVGSHNPAWHEYLTSKALDFGHRISIPRVGGASPSGNLREHEEEA
ncbi:GTP cyclohydrolase II [Microbacterium sp. BWT-G7]|uniref:GTP cyclohydrolase II n=2 Tax=Microbacterium allomyrinae TaxID=2830666 RepID=A0A9X1LX17_9MICO|nr:GTP cyclohydrolase II [Microbacterium allomyrinae]